MMFVQAQMVEKKTPVQSFSVVKSFHHEKRRAAVVSSTRREKSQSKYSEFDDQLAVINTGLDKKLNEDLKRIQRDMQVTCKHISSRQNTLKTNYSKLVVACKQREIKRMGKELFSISEDAL